jgi:hypothetical protein
MANLFVEHKDRWLALAEADTDFAVMFIKAWLPFNVWYCNNYPDKNNKDRPILEEIKQDNNLFRTRLIALLNGNDAESKQFRTLVGQLHIALEKFYIPDASNRITFTNIWFRENPNRIFTLPPKRRLEYKAEIRANNSVQAMILEQGTLATKYSYTYTKYDFIHFSADANLNALSLEQQTSIQHCFKEINPKKKEAIVTDDKRNNINCGDVLLKNNADFVSKALIELLYNLRCILFHGEIQPSKDNLSVYEPAYYVLRILLKSLK